MNVLEHYLLLKNNAIKTLFEIHKITVSNQITQQFSDSVTKTISSIESDKFIVAVVGVIKRGKSTLLNALLKAETDVLSTQVTPETARLAVLNYSMIPSAIIHTSDDQKIEISLEELPSYTSAFDTVSPKGIKEKVEKTRFAEILFPNEILKKGFSFVDTPGVDDPDEDRSKVTLNFIDKADSVIFLMSASEGGLKDSELKFLQSKILNNQGTSKGIVCVMNMISRLRPRQLNNELPKLLEKNEKLINKFFGTNLRIFPIDALDALNGYRKNDPKIYDRSRFEEFKNYLEKYLIDEKGKIFLRIRINKFLEEELNIQIDQLNRIISEKPLTLIEVEKSLKTLDAELVELEGKADKLFKKYEIEKESLNIWIQKAVSTEFNSNISIKPDSIPHLTSDINSVTHTLSQNISKKTERFINDLIDEFKIENIKISKPDFRVEPKSIDTAKYFNVMNIDTPKLNDGEKVGGFIGGVLGAFGGPFLIGVGAVLGSVIGNFFDSDTTEEVKVNFDEMGLKKEIDEIKNKLTKSFQSSLDFYFEEISTSVKRNFDQNRKSIKIIYDSHKRILNNEIKNYDEFKKENQKLINSLANKKEVLQKLLLEVDKL